MTRAERILIGELKKKFPDLVEKDCLKWIYTLNDNFEGLSPFNYEKKYGGKRFKVIVKRLNNM